MAPKTDRDAKKINKKQTVPRLRSHLTPILIYLLAFGFFGASVLFCENLNFADSVCVLFGVTVTGFFVEEIIFRCLHFAEEKQHVVTRYEDSYIRLVTDLFYFPLFMCILAVASISMTVILYIKFNYLCPFVLWYQMGFPSVAFSLLGALVIKRNLSLSHGPLYDSLWIENSHGLDYGSGMAHSFFHGYLKLVLPQTGTGDKNLEELMKDYEDEHHVTLEYYKLFILIPKSLYCPTSLKNDEISPTIEESSSLRSKKITVAGVQNRSYKNSVYKIVSEKGEITYVCAEYATPLKTFKDVVNFNGEHSKFYKKYKNDIVLQFYLTLDKVLKEHENCTNFCELIYYDDKNENGYKDVGRILLNRIKKLKKRAV